MFNVVVGSYYEQFILLLSPIILGKGSMVLFLTLIPSRSELSMMWVPSAREFPRTQSMILLPSTLQYKAFYPLLNESCKTGHIVPFALPEYC